MKASSGFIFSTTIFAALFGGSVASQNIPGAMGAGGLTALFGILSIKIAMEEITAPIAAQLAKLTPQAPASQTPAVKADSPKSP